jgi:hypothetical protein
MKKYHCPLLTFPPIFSITQMTLQIFMNPFKTKENCQLINNLNKKFMARVFEREKSVFSWNRNVNGCFPKKTRPGEQSINPGKGNFYSRHRSLLLLFRVLCAYVLSHKKHTLNIVGASTIVEIFIFLHHNIFFLQMFYKNNSIFVIRLQWKIKIINKATGKLEDNFLGMVFSHLKCYPRRNFRSCWIVT